MLSRDMPKSPTYLSFFSQRAIYRSSLQRLAGPVVAGAGGSWGRHK
jgi:hypothetical protein